MVNRAAHPRFRGIVNSDLSVRDSASLRLCSRRVAVSASLTQGDCIRNSDSLHSARLRRERDFVTAATGVCESVSLDSSTDCESYSESLPLWVCALGIFRL